MTKNRRSKVFEDVWASVDQDAASQLALDLTAIPSPTGEEGPVGEFLLDYFAANGLEPVRQEVEAGRVNAVGILRGEGDGPSLMLNGHIDTGTPFRHEDIEGGLPPATVIKPYLNDDVLFGTGMDNMKSGLAAITSAAVAIMGSGIRLRGDLIVSGVVGEISRAPIDQYQGPHYRGEGVGTRYLLTHGILTDYAIVADTSHFGITWAECGVVYAKVSSRGRALYTPFTRRSQNPLQSDNAIIQMVPIIEAIERWAGRYEADNVYTFAGGEVRPKVSIGSIVAGAPFKASDSPLSCSVYVDIRVPPNRLPFDVQREFRSALETSGVNHEIHFYLSQRGYEGTGVEPIVEAIRTAHEDVVGAPPPEISSAETSMWTDTNLYHEAGIPAVKFGTGAVLRESPDGEIASTDWEGENRTRIPNSTSVDDLITATRIYTSAALQICGPPE